MSYRLAGTSVIASPPPLSSCQNCANPLAPGKRQPMPTTATGVPVGVQTFDCADLPRLVIRLASHVGVV
ncbi:hypothetical protein GCM10023263_72600 [Phytohabitans rumicis]